MIVHVVDVYRNLRRNTFSVREGKVIGYADDLILLDAKFRVSKAGNARVRRENRKNIHAFVNGSLRSINQDSPFEVTPYGKTINSFQDSYMINQRSYHETSQLILKTGKRVSYDPYHNTTFVDESGNPVFNAYMVLLSMTHGIIAKGVS